METSAEEVAAHRRPETVAQLVHSDNCKAASQALTAQQAAAIIPSIQTQCEPGKRGKAGSRFINQTVRNAEQQPQLPSLL